MKEVICGIYGIVNSRNGKIYVGQSRNILFRRKDHKKELENNKHCNQYLQNAYNKDKEHFKFRILEECIEELLHEKELCWVNKYGGINSSSTYNLGNIVGSPVSEATKKKISASQTGKHHTAEAKKKIGDASRGKAGRKRTEEQNKRNSEAQIGKKLSDETKQKISNSNLGLGKGRKLSDEHIKNLRASHIGQVVNHSEETKQKIGNANKGKKRTVEQNLANSNRQKNKKLSEATKLKISESNLIRWQQLKGEASYG